MPTRLLAAGSPLSEERQGPTRREILSFLAKGALASQFLHAKLFGISSGAEPVAPSPLPSNWELTDTALLEDIINRAFLFFWNEASPHTGLVRDRALADGGPDERRVASIAATGYGLAALCIGQQHQYLPSREIYGRVIATLSFLLNHAEHVNGFFYHFLDIETGRRLNGCEVSPIDTTILLCGVLMAREYFPHPDIRELASNIYRRVNWRWMLNGGKTFAKAWTPETHFVSARWDTYSELLMMYLLAVAAPLYGISSSSWDALTRPVKEFQGYSYIGGNDPLFVHQYSQAWFDFRGRRDNYADYFENSVSATNAHKLFCRSLLGRFPDYDDQTWGISASDSSLGYRVWGGPPEIDHLDGTVVPSAAAGSIPFLPKDTITCLRNLYLKYGVRIWKRYGFVDAFNPITGWIDPDVIGIDTGISMVMAENYRSGLIWQTFMRNPEAQKAMQLVGFQPYVQAAGIN